MKENGLDGLAQTSEGTGMPRRRTWTLNGFWPMASLLRKALGKVARQGEVEIIQGVV